MKTKYNITLVGIFSALLLISMLAFGFATLISDLQVNYNSTDIQNMTFNFSKYSYSQRLNKTIGSAHVLDIEATKQEENKNPIVNALDLIGDFFSKGWSGLKTAFKSIDLFNEMALNMSADVPFLSFLLNNLMILVYMVIIIGIGLAALLKWYL